MNNPKYEIRFTRFTHQNRKNTEIMQFNEKFQCIKRVDFMGNVYRGEIDHTLNSKDKAMFSWLLTGGHKVYFSNWKTYKIIA